MFGLAYEYSFLLALGISPSGMFGFGQLAYSGFVHVVPLTVTLTIFVYLVNFFGRKIDKDPREVLDETLKDLQFSGVMRRTRMVAIATLVFWVATVLEGYVFDHPRLFTGYPWLLLFTLAVFGLGFYSAPPHAQFTIFIGFMLTACAGISAMGISEARLMRHYKILRDDSIVTISMKGDGYSAKSKPIELPVPLIERLLDRFS